ncbi:MAG: hypothetical protein KAH38_11645, partial [Candidatus Hydrogenedentes bacterium]|nr:hypothetical protein [Candidatus Hydrogenedentota bacterium]
AVSRNTKIITEILLRQSNGVISGIFNMRISKAPIVRDDGAEKIHALAESENDITHRTYYPNCGAGAI